MVAVALASAQFFRFGAEAAQVAGSEIRYASLTLALAVGWSIALLLRGAYRPDVLGHGSKEFVITITATVQLFALVALLSYALRYQLARGCGLTAPHASVEVVRDHLVSELGDIEGNRGELVVEPLDWCEIEVE